MSHGTLRKITVNVPAELLEKAQEASGAGITQTVRSGLELAAASRAYAQLRQLRGRCGFRGASPGRTLTETSKGSVLTSVDHKV